MVDAFRGLDTCDRTIQCGITVSCVVSSRFCFKTLGLVGTTLAPLLRTQLVTPGTHTLSHSSVCAAHAQQTLLPEQHNVM